jgi:flagellar assembly protein FliH
LSEPRRPIGGLTRPLLQSSAPVERWAMPDVGGPVISRVREERRKADDSVELLRQALQESETRGYEAGLAKAQAETQVSLDALAARIQQLDAVLSLLARPLQQLDADVEKELLNLALAVGKQLARRELRVDPTQIIGIIRESLAQLPASAREIRVHLHPEDAATVRERLAAPQNERAWNIVEDPTLSRGGCVIRTENSQMDVKLESRINAIMANVLGEERAPERPATEQKEPTA